VASLICTTRDQKTNKKAVLSQANRAMQRVFACSSIDIYIHCIKTDVNVKLSILLYSIWHFGMIPLQ